VTAPPELITRQLTNGGRALARRSPSPPAGMSPDTLPTTSGGDVRHPCLWVIRCSAEPDDARRAATTGHQFPEPGLLERRAPPTISFTSPKLTRKPPLPGTPPEVTVRDHHPSPGGPQVIQAGNAAVGPPRARDAGTLPGQRPSELPQAGGQCRPDADGQRNIGSRLVGGSSRHS